MPGPDVRRITRAIKSTVERELWARAAGRCQFRGHNAVLYRSAQTQQPLHTAEKAHIYAFSVDGPRGRGPLHDDPQAINGIDNLMLMCPTCHDEIDADDGSRFPAALLLRWKLEHEDRVERVTAIGVHNKSTVVIYGANVGDHPTIVTDDEAHRALFPDRFPSQPRPIRIGMSWAGRDSEPTYWATESANLRRDFSARVAPAFADVGHFSLFGLAPMPLLTLFGSLFTDKIRAESYQLRREPQPSWSWLDAAPDLAFELRPPAAVRSTPVLVFSLSAAIDPSRITSVLGDDVSIWEIAVAQPHNDVFTSRAQLSQFRRLCRSAIASIARAHGLQTPLHVFPAMPVSAAIEFGRIRMPKADMPWLLYDHNAQSRRFVHALTLESLP